MASMIDLVGVHNARYGIPQGQLDGQPSAFAQFTAPFIEEMKRQREHKIADENAQKTISQFEQLRNMAAGMPDNSDVGKVGGMMGDQAGQSRRGVVKSSAVLPKMKLSLKDGQLNQEIVYETPSPTEQKAALEMQIRQKEIEKQDKSSMAIDAYINGNMAKHDFLKVMMPLGLKGEEFQNIERAKMAVESSQRMTGGTIIPSGYQAGEMVQDEFGNMVPAQIKQIPQTNPMDAVKLQREQLALQKDQQVDVPTEKDNIELERERLALERDRQDANIKRDEYGNPIKTGLSPALQKAKDTRTEKLYQLMSDNQVKRDQIDIAKEAATRFQGGVYGAATRAALKAAGADSPILTDWQNIKMVLTDAQLLNTAKTKGAISDQEMKLFSKAAANDDIGSVAEMRPVFDKLIKFIEADERSARDSYKRIYNEDPQEWFGGQETANQDQGGKYQVGQIIDLPNGKKAKVTGFFPDGDPDVELMQ